MHEEVEKGVEDKVEETLSIQEYVLFSLAMSVFTFFTAMRVTFSTESA